MIVDLRSDTVTQPTPAMKQAMVDAPLGDDVLGDDPTVQRLEAVMAERTGKEAALFVPSGSMSNLIAITVHTRPGDAVVCHRDCHPYNYEAGGAAVVAGAQLWPVDGPRGLPTLSAVSAAIRGADPHFAPATLLTVEDTANRGGGAVASLADLDALADLAHARGLGTHLDGARIWNAVVASGVPLSRRVQGYDTVSCCFSKGLGAPVGSVWCGPSAMLEHARRVRKLLGGGMRQSGMLAAACLYALEHHVDRLADDHHRAREVAEGLRAAGFAVELPESNMVYVTVEDAPAWQDRLEARGVRCFAVSPDALRLVFHLGVDDAGVSKIGQAFRDHSE